MPHRATHGISSDNNMLKHLYIKNYTLIDELDIDLHPGFSVITGETGAGKSIILEKTNVLDCLDGAYLGAGATIYRGGDFLCNGLNFAAAQTTNYLGTWSLDQIVEW